jgi:hypothetical protein
MGFVASNSLSSRAPFEEMVLFLFKEFSGVGRGKMFHYDGTKTVLVCSPQH